MQKEPEPKGFRFYKATRMRLELTTRIRGHQLSRLADYQLSHLVKGLIDI